MSKDRDYLLKIQDYYAEHKTLPSFSSIAQLLGFKSKNAVAALVARLQLEGYLDRTPDNRLKPGKRFFERELAESSVRAGFPSEALEETTEALTIDDFLVERPSETVLIKVKGDSMTEAGIMAGDIVVVERRSIANVGDIVVAIIDNEFTLKILGRENNLHVLIPANEDYPILRPENGFELFGVVVGQFRKYG